MPSNLLPTKHLSVAASKTTEETAVSHAVSKLAKILEDANGNNNETAWASLLNFPKPLGSRQRMMTKEPHWTAW